MYIIKALFTFIGMDTGAPSVMIILIWKMHMSCVKVLVSLGTHTNDKNGKLKSKIFINRNFIARGIASKTLLLVFLSHIYYK